MSSYQPNIPTGLLDLSVDYQNIQTNFQQLNTSFGVDHIPFSQAAQNGYHVDIHFNPLPSVPAPTAGFGQLFTQTTNDGINTDQILYYLSGGGKNIQLTRNLQPALATNGYTFLPGGLILQYGLKTIPGAWPSGTDQTITFTTNVPANIDFPNECFGVFTTFRGASSSSGDIGIVSISKTAFKWNFGGSSNASYTGFYWWAIGW